MSNLQPEISNDPQITEAYHFPIVKAFADRIGLVDTINSLVPCNTKISPGHTILAMVIDTLSGRSPLYRLDDFFENQDTELLLGAKIDPSDFSDHNVGRILDRCFEAGPTKIYSQIVQNAIRGFGWRLGRGGKTTTTPGQSPRAAAEADSPRCCRTRRCLGRRRCSGRASRAHPSPARASVARGSA